MTRTVTMAAIALFACSATASNPALTRPPRKSPAQSPNVNNPILKAMARAEARDRQMARDAFASFATPQFQIRRFIEGWPYESDPMQRALRLLESEDLRAAREQWHRIWMNNQPAVLEYKRLNGAIGP